VSNTKGRSRWRAKGYVAPLGREQGIIKEYPKKHQRKRSFVKGTPERGGNEVAEEGTSSPARQPVEKGKGRSASSQKLVAGKAITPHTRTYTASTSMYRTIGICPRTKGTPEKVHGGNPHRNT